MADISQLKLPNNDVYDIKDAVMRSYVSASGNANCTNAILYGTVDSTSTATVYTATVEGLDKLVDGTCVMLHNGVVTSASGFTVNINGLGAKKCYNNMTNATQDTTIFNASYTMLFVYSTSLDSGNGGWWIYRGYDGNTNTIGYQLRPNSGNKVASDTGYRYRLWLTSADGSKWVPINTSSSTNSTTARTLNTRPIDPFGPIVYRATNGTCSSGSGIGATGIWQQYTLTIGYSYMKSKFSLSFPDSVYLRCTPQADGSAVMQDIVQALPTTKDGKIYIHLGTAYSATNMELTIEHPVYWYDGTGIRLWTGAEPTSGGGGSNVTITPILTSGTQVATIGIDGTSTTLYAPSGGTEMVVLSYGSSNWAEFLAAYQTNAVVYCRASSQSDPAVGDQTRMAFMAYVNDEDSPTEVEFQYYRSISTHSASQQGDQVYIYKLTSAGAWTVTVREACIKIAAGTGLTSSFASNTLTISSDSNSDFTGATASSAGARGLVPTPSAGQNASILVGEGGWHNLDFDSSISSDSGSYGLDLTLGSVTQSGNVTDILELASTHVPVATSTEIDAQVVAAGWTTTINSANGVSF